MTKRLFVGNLDSGVGDGELNGAVAKHATVISANVATEKSTRLVRAMTIGSGNAAARSGHAQDMSLDLPLPTTQAAYIREAVCVFSIAWFTSPK